MTEIKFFADGNTVNGFTISGHSSFDCDDTQGKLICSAISSAAYMTANTVTEIIGDKAKAEVRDGFMKVNVKNPSEKTVAVLLGFKLHIEQLSLQYKDRISILSEV